MSNNFFLFFFAIAVHKVGKVELQVAREGVVVSNAVLFEYKLITVDAINSAPENWTRTLFSWLFVRLEYLSSQLDIQGCGIDGLFNNLVRLSIFA